MGAEPLGWIGAEFVIISIIHNGAAFVTAQEGKWYLKHNKS